MSRTAQSDVPCVSASSGLANPRRRQTHQAAVALMVAALTVGLLSGPVAARPTAGSTPAAGGTPAVESVAGITYREVDGEELLLDACLPANAAEPLPAVVLVHGGGWHHGRRDAPQWRSLCTDLATAGFATFSVDYRLAPEHPFPAAFDDVQAAIGWLREPEQVDRFGIDPDWIGILGGSAGGQLAGLVGTAGEGDLTAGARVRAVVSLSGPMDLTVAALDRATPVHPEQVQSALRFLGCADIDDCPASEAASPVLAIDPTDPPFLLVNAADDPVVPAEQAETMGVALDAAGVSNDVIVVPGSAHATHLLDDPDVTADVFAFLDEHLAG